MVALEGRLDALQEQALQALQAQVLLLQRRHEALLLWNAPQCDL
jgi:hypothetical protein